MSLHTLLPLDTHGIVSRAEAIRVGLNDVDLRRLARERRLVVLRRGVYVDAAVWDESEPFRAQPILRMRAAQRVLRCEHVLSHDSSAIILGLGAPDPRRSLVHVTRGKVHGDAVRAGVKHHLAPYLEEQVLVVEGLRVLDPARTALDMGREHGLVAGVACCDAALRLGASRDDLTRARACMFCWPGSRVMDAALDLADPGAESWLESEGRVFVTSLRIGRPETQFGLTDGDRTVWCDLRVGRHVFELDGDLKYLPGNPSGKDARAVLLDEKERQDFVTGFKLGVSRIGHRDLRRRPRETRERVLREYLDTCARFGTDITDLAAYRPAKTRR